MKQLEGTNTEAAQTDTPRQPDSAARWTTSVSLTDAIGFEGDDLLRNRRAQDELAELNNLLAEFGFKLSSCDKFRSLQVSHHDPACVDKLFPQELRERGYQPSFLTLLNHLQVRQLLDTFQQRLLGASEAKEDPCDFYWQ